MDLTGKAGPPVSLTTAIMLVGLSLAGLALVLRLVEGSKPCRRCAGIGTQRAPRGTPQGGRWAAHCTACRGSGRVDGLMRRVLVAATKGRVLPDSGTVAPGGRTHAQGVVFDGRHPGGRWRARADPVDTRAEAIEGRRLPAAERAVERAEARLAAASVMGKVAALVRLAVARRRLRKTEDLAERHRLDLADHSAVGYRRMAGRGRAVTRPGGGRSRTTLRRGRSVARRLR